jgi:hypothetical protein
MTAYEYIFVAAPGSTPTRTWEALFEELKRLGAEGWRMVAPVSSYGTTDGYFLMRERP